MGCNNSGLSLKMTVDVQKMCNESANRVLESNGLLGRRIEFEDGVFANGKLIGCYKTSLGNIRLTLVSIANNFGVVTAMIQPGQGDDQFNIKLYMSGENDKMLQGEEIIMTRRASGVDVELVQKKHNLYDLNCLKTCAPSCFACSDDWVCWSLCAGSCVILCAF